MDKTGLTEEQKRRIEENKRKALAKRQEKLGQPSPQPQRVAPFQKSSSAFTAKESASTSRAAPPDWVGTATHQNKFQNQGTATCTTRAAPSDCTSSDHQKDVGSWHSKPTSSNQTSYQKRRTGFNKWNNNQSSSSANNGSGLNKWNSNQTASQTSGLGKTQFYGQGQKPLKGQCVLISRDRFEVHIKFNEAVVAAFKTITSRIYDAASRTWSFDIKDHETLLKAVSGLRPGVQVQPLPKAVLQVFAATHQGARVIPQADLSQVDAVLVQSLMPFQREGVNFGVYLNGRVLIADDMGLGKTLQAICLASVYRAKWPLLVVTPSSVRFDWAQQFKRWLPSLDPARIHVSVTGRDDPASGLVNIISYDLLSRKVKDLTAARFRVIIMDESHFLKNSKTVRTKSALPLLQAAQHIVLLSGTPALSRPSELYTQIVAVCPRMFKFHDFGLRYCKAKEMPWGWDYSGSSNMGELQLLLEEKIMIRRMKQDVLSQLPAKRRQMVILDPVSVASSRALVQASKIMQKKLSGSEKRGALLQYFHETGKVKVAAVRSYVQDMVAAEKKFLIFAHHQEMLDCIEDVVVAENVQYIRIDGSTTAQQRHHFCNKFQSKEECKVAVLSITAANAGLNMAAAAIVVFAELFWNPGILVQAEDRAHRLGQQDSVLVYYLVAQKTADDYIWPLVQNKLQVLGKAGLAGDDLANTDDPQIQDPEKKHILDMFEESFIEEGSEDVPDNPSPAATTCQDTVVRALQSTPPKTTFGPSPSKRRKVSPVKGQQGIGQFFHTDKILSARSPKKAGHSVDPGDPGPSVWGSHGAEVSEQEEREGSTSPSVLQMVVPSGGRHGADDAACADMDMEMGEEDLANLAADIDWDDDDF